MARWAATSSRGASGVNQRETTASAIASMPSVRTSSARSCQPVGLAEAGRAARDDEAVDPLRRVRREPQPGRAPERDAAEGRALDPELVEQPERVAPEQLE